MKLKLEAGTFNILQPDGFFVPYGNFPHKNGVQKFDKAAAQAMADHFNSLLSKVANVFAGPAVYIGHPDVPGRGAEFPDKKAYGRITGIEPREDGCHFAAKMNKEGVELIANSSFAYYSPFWGCEKTQGGIKPVQLYSIGLTNTPNIDVPALANDDDSTQKENTTTMIDKILTALKEAGIVKDGDSEDSVLGQIGELIRSLAWGRERKAEEKAQAAKLRAAMNAAENDADTLDILIDRAVALIPSANDTANAQITMLEEKKTGIMAECNAANDKLAEVNGLIEAANEALVTARTAAANSALDLAVTSGRLIEADRETKRGELLAIENTAGFATALTTLVTTAPVIKTANVTAGLGKDGKSISAANEANAKGEQRRALVEKCKEKFPKLTGSALWDAATNAARAAEPALFA